MVANSDELDTVRQASHKNQRLPDQRQTMSTSLTGNSGKAAVQSKMTYSSSSSQMNGLWMMLCIHCDRCTSGIGVGFKALQRDIMQPDTPLATCPSHQAHPVDSSRLSYVCACQLGLAGQQYQLHAYVS